MQTKKPRRRKKLVKATELTETWKGRTNAKPSEQTAGTTTTTE